MSPIPFKVRLKSDRAVSVDVARPDLQSVIPSQNKLPGIFATYDHSNNGGELILCGNDVRKKKASVSRYPSKMNGVSTH
jgi:hypothetical protein